MPAGAAIGGLTPDKPFVASMGIYVFSRDVLLEILERPGIDFGKEIIPTALGDAQRAVAYLSAATGPTSGRSRPFYDANIS